MRIDIQVSICEEAEKRESVFCRELVESVYNSTSSWYDHRDESCRLSAENWCWDLTLSTSALNIMYLFFSLLTPWFLSDVSFAFKSFDSKLENCHALWAASLLSTVTFIFRCIVLHIVKNRDEKESRLNIPSLLFWLSSSELLFFKLDQLLFENVTSTSESCITLSISTTTFSSIKTECFSESELIIIAFSIWEIN